MSDPRTINLLGALALALADDVQQSTAHCAGHGAAAPAAIVTIKAYSGSSIDQVSQILRLSHSGTVRLIDRLAADGLVERRPSSDGRAVALYLTPDGEHTYHTISAARQTALEAAMQGLTHGEQTELATLLEKLLAQITRDDRHADYICRLCDETVCPQESCPVTCAAHTHGDQSTLSTK